MMLEIYVQPGAKKTEWAGRHGDHPKLRVKAPPVDGAANEAIVEFLAGFLGVPAREIELVAGHKSRLKRFRVPDGAGAKIPSPAP